MERRNRPHEEHENHERWLVSYADFITLMFAFFVVMFASSQADKSKVASVSVAVAEALEQGALPPKVLEMLGKGGRDKKGGASQKGMKDLKADLGAGKLAELTPSMRKLTAELQPEIRQGKLDITLEARGLVISLKEAAFFPTGDATISQEGLDILSKVADTIRKVANPVRLEGHTDSIPIHNSRYANNWELSAARSIAMLQLLNSYEVPAHRMAVVGYAETIAVDTNDTADGRAKNRRVDVTILSEAAANREPQPIKGD